jgi:hypothetical protein
MRSGQETKAAAEWLYRYQDRLPYHDRHVIARKVLEKAAQYGAGIDALHTEFLEKQAGMGVCDPKEVHEMIMQRAKLAKNAEHREQIEKLAATVKDKPRAALQPDQLVKLAVTMDMVDQSLGLKWNDYGDILRKPEDVIFSATFTKLASDHAELCPLTSGTVYAKGQFEKLSRENVEALFGTDFVREVSDGLAINGEKMASVAAALPLPDAELLDRLMEDSKLLPQMQKAASAGHGLSNAQLEALAAAYELPPG